MSRRALVCGERKALLVQVSSREMKEVEAGHLRGWTTVRLSHFLHIVTFSDLRGGTQNSWPAEWICSAPVSWLPLVWLGSVDCMTKPKSWSLGRRSCGDQPRKCLPTSDGNSFMFQIILRKQASILLRLQIIQAVTCRKMVRTQMAWWEESCGNHQVERVGEVHMHSSCSILIIENQRSWSFCFSEHVA